MSNEVSADGQNPTWIQTLGIGCLTAISLFFGNVTALRYGVTNIIAAIGSLIVISVTLATYQRCVLRAKAVRLLCAPTCAWNLWQLFERFLLN